jgi:hypothetical protein
MRRNAQTRKDECQWIFKRGQIEADFFNDC